MRIIDWSSDVCSSDLTAGGGLADSGYDIADPAFHPFDWGSMTAMVALLEMRLGRPESDADAGRGASAPCAASNRDASERARATLGIVPTSPARDPSSPGDSHRALGRLHPTRRDEQGA